MLKNSRVWTLRRDRRGVAALEFVLVAPILIILLFGVYDISNALIVYQQVYAAAESMAASVSNAAVQSNGTNALTFSKVQQAESELWADVPSLRADYQDGVKSVTISSIVFEPLISGCTAAAVYTAANSTPQGTNPCSVTPAGTDYVPVVVWSIAYAGGDSGRTFQVSNSTLKANQSYYPAGTDVASTTSIVSATSPLRSCSSAAANSPSTPNPTIYGALNQTIPTLGSSSDLTNLRTQNLTTPDPSAAPPSPMLVVDVHLQYMPVIGLFIKAPLNFWVSGYWPVRSVQTSVTQTFQLYQEFATLNPDVPTTVTTPTEYNGNAVVYNSSGGLVSTDDYCVNNTLPNETFPYSAESSQ